MSIQDFDFATKTVKNPKRNQVFAAIDNNSDLSTLCDVLREKRFHVVGKATDYVAALELVRKHKVGILFVDADFQGIEVASMMDKLKINYPEVRVVIISGSPTRELVEAATSRDAIGFLTKPLNKNAILKITKLL